MKWILYDIGGVLELVDDDRWPQMLEKSWSDRLGLSVDALRARVEALEARLATPMGETAAGSGAGIEGQGPQ